MTRSQLIVKVARQTGLPAAQIENVLDTIVDDLIEALQNDEKVTIAGFGRFEMRDRKTKAYTNPKTKVASQLDPTQHSRFQGQRAAEATGAGRPALLTGHKRGNESTNQIQ